MRIEPPFKDLHLCLRRRSFVPPDSDVHLRSPLEEAVQAQVGLCEWKDEGELSAMLLQPTAGQIAAEEVQIHVLSWSFTDGNAGRLDIMKVEGLRTEPLTVGPRRRPVPAPLPELPPDSKPDIFDLADDLLAAEPRPEPRTARQRCAAAAMIDTDDHVIVDAATEEAVAAAAINEKAVDPYLIDMLECYGDDDFNGEDIIQN
eukprot:11166332-Lingulodinium_polyedra.AAC.1